MQICGKLLLSLLAAAFSFIGCAQQIDLGRDIEPSQIFTTKHIGTLDKLKEVPSSERQAYLKDKWPTLTTDILALLAEHGRIKSYEQIESVIYGYFETGSGQVFANGILQSGDVKDELIAFIKIKGSEEKLKIIVRSLNVLSKIKGKLTNAGGYYPMTSFAIAPGKSLANYVGIETAIMLAERHGLKITAKSNGKVFEVTPGQAYQLIDLLDKTQITVKVFPGDKFNVIKKTMTSGRK